MGRMWTALNLGRRRRSLLTVHLKPYWGKPAVRNFRGGRGNPKLDRARRAPLPYSAQVKLKIGLTPRSPRSDPAELPRSPCSRRSGSDACSGRHLQQWALGGQPVTQSAAHCSSSEPRALISGNSGGFLTIFPAVVCDTLSRTLQVLGDEPG